MAKTDLLSTALVEARELRRSAVALSKLQLEEDFQPTLQRMISTKIAEEEGDDENLDINIEVEPEESEPTGMASFEPETPEAPEEDSLDQELESLYSELDGGEEELAEMDGEEDDLFAEEDDMFAEGEEESWQDPIEEPVAESKAYYKRKYGLTEAEIQALSALVEEDGLGDIDGPEDEDGGAYLHDVPSTSLNTEVRRLRAENAKLRRQVSESKKQVNKAYRVVTEQKTIINQVNLLNAKLMFAQKATRYGKLSESQKVKVINAIDRASSVREVKLVYTSILEALKRNETSTKRPVTEGLASKSTKSVGRSTTGGDNIIKENWQRLAGILPPKDY